MNRFASSHRTLAGLAALAAVVVLSSPVAGQSNADQSVPFEADKTHALTTVAGPVKVTTLKLTNLGRGYSRGGISLRSVSPPSELSTTMRLAFDVNNPTREEWDVTFTVEFMDKAGKVVDRVSKKENYENESGVLTIEHPLLEYVIPMISTMRVSIVGRKS
jgi:hypothetical protein